MLTSFSTEPILTMEKIILDTNFLLIPYQFKIDIFTEINRIFHFKYTLFILDKTLDELENIVEKQRGKDREAAKFALKLLDAKGIKIIKSGNDKHVDDSIVDIASQGKVIVATQDKILKKKLEAIGIPLIIMRQKKRLELIGYGYSV